MKIVSNAVNHDFKAGEKVRVYDLRDGALVGTGTIQRIDNARPGHDPYAVLDLGFSCSVRCLRRLPRATDDRHVKKSLEETFNEMHKPKLSYPGPYRAIVNPAEGYCVVGPTKISIADCVDQNDAQIIATALNDHTNSAAQVALLRAIRERCPGVDTTDQVTGETFATLITKLVQGKRS